MQRQERIDVLVVGAGPAGMLTALTLAQGGVRPRVIDQESRTTSRTYACALHPRTLALMNQLGLAGEILEAGRRIETVAFYEGGTRQAEVKLSDLHAEFPFVVVLAQSVFEQMLEEKLRQEYGVEVAWNHQLSEIRVESDSAIAVVDKLAISAQGYIVPEMEWSVQKTEELRARYVIGADGPNSRVAKSLGLLSDAVGQPEFYAVYEFESDWNSGDEVRVALTPETTSVLWPLPGNKFRWSFQLLEEHLAVFPAKERRNLTIGDPALDDANRAFIQRLVAARAPWFTGAIQEIGWSTDVEFQRRLAKEFGQGRCWLVGDAAHQTSPAGMQSMNRGVAEAAQIAGAVVKIIQHGEPPKLLQAYADGCRSEWQQLLGLASCPKPRPDTSGWIKEQRGRLLPCLPASGEHFVQLLAQLHLDV